MEELKIINEKENPIFDRKEIEGEFVSDAGSVSKSKVMAFLSSKYGVSENHIDLKYVISLGGRSVGKFFALVYRNPIREEEAKKEEEVKENG